ncbi:MAG: GAF domain-containing protein, partial [Actinomycetota bacterium]|nr:GAF domain-containing protein [Actinomycetota bacterium]
RAAAGVSGGALDAPLPAPVEPGEAPRLALLRRLRVLDTAPEARFDDLARVAAAVCGAPMAGLAFVDAERVWLKSGVGPVTPEEPRTTSPAAWTILQRDPLVVPDAAADRRFAAHPSVAAHPQVRFWAGAPVVTRDGHPLAVLFVADTEPRRLGAEEYDALRSLARQVASLLELRAHELDLDASSASLPVDGPLGERARLVRQLLGDGGGPDKLLRTREVALLFDVSERTVNYWASQGRLPSRQTAGGHRRYASRDVLQLFQSSSQLLVES